MTKVPDAQPAVSDAQPAPVAPAVRPEPPPIPEQAPVPPARTPLARARSAESTARFAAQSRVSGQVPRLRTSSFAKLESRAKGQASRVLDTSLIGEDELPYPCTLRPPQAVGALTRALFEMPIALMRGISDVVLASDGGHGKHANVRLGELSGGRPVAVVGSAQGVANEQLAATARSLALFDRLGIGPAFHGIAREGVLVHAVIDVVPGAVNGMPVTERTFADVETIIVRLQRAGLETLDDCLVYRTPSSRLLVIAGESVASRLGDAPRASPDAAHGAYTELRLGQLRAADEELRRAYLAELRTLKPEIHTVLCERLGLPTDR